MAELTPMMKQYLEVKEQYKDCILFFRLGDFYEMFFEDAITASKELEITLTGKDCGQEEKAPMCGVPFHAAENYIQKLISKGYKVAIGEQLEDASTTKGIVKRDVVRVVTPGTVIEGNILEEKDNNYIMSIFKSGIFFGIAVCDISTGDFLTTEINFENNFEKLLDEIAKFSPAEIVVNPVFFNTAIEISKIKERFNSYISLFSDDNFSNDIELLKKYDVQGIDKKELIISATNGLMGYLKQTQKIGLQHINKINVYKKTEYMSLDINARRNLELTEKMRDKNKTGTLLWVLDKTDTSMGARLLKRWINSPLLDSVKINKRLNAVKELNENEILRGNIKELLNKIYDIERLIGRISYGNANGKDLISLKNSIKQLPDLKNTLQIVKSGLLKELYENLDTVTDVYDLIEKAIEEEPPMAIKDGGIIKKGFNPEIDTLKTATTEGKNWIIELEAKEKEETGIKNLKVGYNRLFGYYIEVTKSYLNLVPDRFVRKQTLANCERYITEDLKMLEEKILGAEEKIVALEYELFIQIRDVLTNHIERMQKSANIISILDVLSSFAEAAKTYNYVMPIVDDSEALDIKEGRHPVIEKMLPSGSFIQNDTYLDTEADRLSIITGPNMAGKSTYMRQVALITIMAQIGSFVPASYAKIGTIDKVFTRVGASDDLSMGQSTFMVEMMEVASIIQNATKKSLIILDEIGRGTSTFDGLSIAWAVVEYIANKEKIGAKTLFATHYHELTELEDKLEGVKNYSIAVKEKGEDVIFLRKIVRGGTDESYGIHVAKLAGVPAGVVSRANEILMQLEKNDIVNSKKEKEDKKKNSGQLDMYNYKLAELAHEIDKINLNELTPIDALNILVKIKDKIK